jgi:hypothetical protein
VNEQGPLLEAMTHRLAECPPEFLLPPSSGTPAAGTIDIVAIVCDYFRDISGAQPSAVELQKMRSRADPMAVNRLRMIALATWLLHDDFFLRRQHLAERIWQLLSQELDDLAVVVRAEDIVKDPDRREGFVRLCFKHLGLRPKGESINQASDRLTMLDSAERLRVVRETRESEARARRIREQMAAEAARAAAARYSPE